MNGTGNDQYISAEAVPIPLPDCVRFLARLSPKLPPEQRPHVLKLREQIKNFHTNPEAMRPRILDTIEAIENAA